MALILTLADPGNSEHSPSSLWSRLRRARPGSNPELMPVAAGRQIALEDLINCLSIAGRNCRPCSLTSLFRWQQPLHPIAGTNAVPQRMTTICPGYGNAHHLQWNQLIYRRRGCDELQLKLLHAESSLNGRAISTSR